jgi:hypothetical protein
MQPLVHPSEAIRELNQTLDGIERADGALPQLIQPPILGSFMPEHSAEGSLDRSLTPVRTQDSSSARRLDC